LKKEEVTFIIDNLGYTVSLEEKIKDELLKHLDVHKNNSTKDLFAAFIKLSKEYNQFKDEINKIDEKLKRFS
jgi:cell fate (sporulation/competence/biofilm development) regulator YlbF (YheA/YmcA/DUF963 family)